MQPNIDTNFEYTSKRVKYKDSEIQTYTFGSGSHTIFSFPSFPHSGLYYLFFAKFYPHHNYRFVTFDLPGWTGWSENLFKTNNLAKIPTFLDIAETVLQEYGVDKFSIIGYSFGAALAFMLAAKHESRIERLVLTSPVVFGDLTHGTEEWNKLRLVKYLSAHKLMKASFNSHTRALLPYFRRYITEDLLDMYMAMFANSDSKVLLDSIWELFTVSNKDLISKVAKINKIMVVNSIEESELFRTQAEYLRRHLQTEQSLKTRGTHDDFIVSPTSAIVNTVMDFLTERRI